MVKRFIFPEAISSEELPEPYRTISYTIGVDSTLKLAEEYQGTGLYLPKLDGYLRKLRDDRIRKEFNGSNYRDLAHKYKLTEVWIRKVTSCK